MTTINSVNTTLSGQTGTGAFAGSVSPTFTTPALGTPSSGVLSNCTGVLHTITHQAFTGSGTYTPTSGMVYCIIEAWAAVVDFLYLQEAQPREAQVLLVMYLLQNIPNKCHA